MNEFTFIYELNAHLFHDPATPYPQSSMADEMYIVRWSTKYTRETAARKAKALVAEHIQKRMDDGELVVKHPYWKRRQELNDFSATRAISPKIAAWSWGHPKIVRIDQPEGSK